MKISVIVATYNRIDALSLVLQSLETQSDPNFEVLIADDGSRPDTTAFVNDFRQQSCLKLTHVWQEDAGFRLARIRNLATQQASGEYLIYLDGDCMVQPGFVAAHRRLAQPHTMVTGSRILLEQALTQQLCAGGQWDWPAFRQQALHYRWQGQMNKCLPLFVHLPDHPWRRYPKFVWRRIKGCNMAAWREDVLRVGGFDEGLEGWGHEDADFVFRLHEAGVGRKSGSWATEVLHLWHKMADKESAEKNAATVRAKILAKQKRWGINQ